LGKRKNVRSSSPPSRRPATKTQWKTLRTTNVIERLHGEFRRRVKTQGPLPSEDAALILLFSLVASGQIKLRRINGWKKIAAVLSQHTEMAA
jgi:putative transposase